MERQQRRLAAILAADVAGYSRLMAADEAGTLARFKRLRRELIEPAVEQFGGRLVGEAGDSLLIEFGGASDAVSCAVEVQDKLAAFNAEIPEDRRMRFRMGVNLGEVIIDGATIHGDGVNVAARIEKLANPGDVMIARAVHDQVKGRVPYAFEDLGEKTLHNIAEPVRVFRVARAEASGATVEGRAERQDVRVTIAVLPFNNMSGDPEQEYFSDGITEDIITELSRFRSLRVVARNSSFAFKGKPIKIKDVAKELGATHLVEGSVRKAASRIRITVQLVEAASGMHVWAERYDRDLADVFAVQDEVTRAIVSTLPVRLDEGALDRARRNPTKNPTAYDYLLRARSALFHTTGDKRAAFDWLAKAIAADPECAPAHAILAYAYAYGIYALGLTFDDASLKAREHADRALAIDSGDAFIHALAANVYSIRGEHELARLHSDRAIEINPNDLDAISGRGFILNNAGESAAGLDWILRALRLVPHDPDDTLFEDLIECYFSLEEYGKVIEAFDHWRAPPFSMYLMLAAAHAQLGHASGVRSAVAEYERLRPPDYSISNLITALERIKKRRIDHDRLLDGFRKAGLIP